MALVENPIVSKVDKTTVNYRLGVKCLNCVNYVQAGMMNASSACRKVEGTIAPEAVCDLWEATEKSGPYNKEFFMKESEGANGE